MAAVEVVSLDGDAILNSTNITGLCVSIDWGAAGSTAPTKVYMCVTPNAAKYDFDIKFDAVRLSTWQQFNQ